MQLRSNIKTFNLTLMISFPLLKENTGLYKKVHSVNVL